jgi:hypothetical protein
MVYIPAFDTVRKNTVAQTIAARSNVDRTRTEGLTGTKIIKFKGGITQCPQ